MESLLLLNPDPISSPLGLNLGLYSKDLSVHLYPVTFSLHISYLVTVIDPKRT